MCVRKEQSVADAHLPIDSEGRAEEIETKKQEQLRKQKEGKGHWEEGLASDGEAAVGVISSINISPPLPTPDSR